MESEPQPGLSIEEKFLQRQAIWERAQREVVHADWQDGATPWAYVQQAPLVHAQTVLDALDAIAKALAGLSHIADAPADVLAAHDQYRNALPHMKGIRDSAQHVDERGVGRKQGQTIQVQPVTGGTLPGGGSMIMDSLDGDDLSYTKDDGSLGSVPITEQSVRLAQRAIQQVIDAFQWSGAPQYAPE